MPQMVHTTAYSAGVNQTPKFISKSPRQMPGVLCLLMIKGDKLRSWRASSKDVIVFATLQNDGCWFHFLINPFLLLFVSTPDGDTPTSVLSLVN